MERAPNEKDIDALEKDVRFMRAPAAAGGERCGYLFVVQQEIDELRDLNVVNCDLGLVPGGADQVLLPGAL